MLKAKTPGINYGRRWRIARELFLARNPFCADPDCRHGGRLVPAEVVDHVVPHRGDPRLFWDYSNWQPLCEECHNRKTMREMREISEIDVASKLVAVLTKPSARIDRPHADVVLDTQEVVAMMAGVERAVVQPRTSEPVWRARWEAADAMIEAAVPRLLRAGLCVAVITDDVGVFRRLEARGATARSELG